MVRQLHHKKTKSQQVAALGRRAPAYTREGSTVRASKSGRGLHLVGTILAACERGARIVDGRLAFSPQDLQGAVRRAKESNLIVFVVDASGSMAARDRLSAVTAAVHSLLGDAYQRRDKVAVISVRGAQPELLLPPTSSIDIAHRRLQNVSTGGRTPLPEGLLLAQEVIVREQRREPGRRAILVVLSDGRATGVDGLQKLRTASAVIAQSGSCASVVIDCEATARVRLGLAADLARHLGAPCVQLAELNADSVTGIINAF